MSLVLRQWNPLLTVCWPVNLLDVCGVLEVSPEGLSPELPQPEVCHRSCCIRKCCRTYRHRSAAPTVIGGEFSRILAEAFCLLMWSWFF